MLLVRIEPQRGLKSSAGLPHPGVRGLQDRRLFEAAFWISESQAISQLNSSCSIGRCSFLGVPGAAVLNYWRCPN